MTGDLVGAIAQLGEVIAEADPTHDTIWGCAALCMQALALAYHGDPSAARAAANAAIEAAAELGGFYPGSACVGLIAATVAAGDVAAADDAIAAGLPHLSLHPKIAANLSRLRGPGGAGARGSNLGQTLDRRSRRGDERRSPVGGADDARRRCDRAG